MEGLIIALLIMSECKRHIDEHSNCDGCIFLMNGNCQIKVDGISNQNLKEKLEKYFYESKEFPQYACSQIPFINKPCVSEGACHEDKMKVLEKIRAEILEEKECAYADFERYKVEYLGQDWEEAYDSLPQDDFRYGMERCIEIINKYMKESEE